MEKMSPQALEQIAAYFKALSDPTRLKILRLLGEEQYSVGELAQFCNFSSANISRHLAILNRHGLITRHSQGAKVFYQLSDESTYQLCEMVCQIIERQISAQKEAFL